MGPDDGWNHNIHYHEDILAHIPASAQSALDIGCGEGLMTRKVRLRVPEVTGIDLDQSSIAVARRHESAEAINYIAADFLTFPFDASSFDVITSVAVLHHMEARAALCRMRELLRPGGMLGAIGLARSTAVDLPYQLAGAIRAPWLRRGRPAYQTRAPLHWPPDESFTSMRKMVKSVLPGAIYRRRSLWRYTLVWFKE